jgi:DNA-binding NarL/FixJ family response regulator
MLDAEDDMTVVGEASDGDEAVDAVARARPDVVLMDVRMPNVDGIEATRRILADGRSGTARILMLTTFDLDEYVYAALRAGASGFLLKDVPPQALVDAVRAIAAGDALLAPAVTRRLIEHALRGAPAPGPPPAELAQLTPRELEVFRLVARGRSNAEIAAELVVEIATVKSHVARLLTKLHLRDRVQAVVLAYETGLLVPGRSD